ncbi:allantoinase AllB [soil metagenome]
MIPEESEDTLWALRSRRVVLPAGIGPATVLVRGEKIAAVVGWEEVPTGIRVEDVESKLILPGLVDTHVHINEPGRPEWEGFATATKAAAAGGVTTLIDMPLNSNPVTTTVAALQAKRASAAEQICVDVGFHAGIVPGNSADVVPLIDAGVVAFKAFLCHSGIDDFPNATEADLRAAMPMLAKAGLPLFVHAEIVAPLAVDVDAAFEANPKSYAAYLATRPVAWEIEAIQLLIRLCRETRCHVHIVHLSAAKEARQLILAAKAEGLPLTVETCPHYLTFVAEEVPDADTRFKCAPPIRERSQRDALRAMVKAGEIDTLGSDHSPAPPELKQIATGNLKQAWGGIASLQLLLPAAYTALGESAFPALSSKPAALVGLGNNKGTIAAGYDADLVVFDSDASFVVNQDALHHRHKATPYDGLTLVGVVESTYLRGRRIYHQGEFEGEPCGAIICPDHPRPQQS